MQTNENMLQCKDPINPLVGDYNRTKQNDFSYFKKRKIEIPPPRCMHIWYDDPCENVNLFNETGITKNSPICNLVSVNSFSHN